MSGDGRITLSIDEVVVIISETTGMKGNLASAMAEAFMRGVTVRYGGLQVYVPKKCKTRSSIRNQAVCADLEAGLTRDEICRRHHISRSQFYRIVGSGE